MKKQHVTMYNQLQHLQHVSAPRPKHNILPNLGVIKYKPSALFQNLCNSCISVRTLLLLSCVHSLGLGLDLGNSLDRRERMRAHT